jgi:alpha-D-ribose 1-methylphosphonate 5-triphosphate synthase subunit PhnL
MTVCDETMIEVEGLTKLFTLHLQGGIELPVLNDFSVTVRKCECLILTGPSGIGKSSLLRCIYGNYVPQKGSLRIRHDGKLVELVGATPKEILALRRTTMGYVRHFLHVVPRLGTLDLVMEPVIALGLSAESARHKAMTLLNRLNIPERLWSVPPATFSGGEQQRVNIARSFIADYPILLLDEPTSALDHVNRAVVVELVVDARQRGAAIVGIVHDEDVRDAIATSTYDLAATKLYA